MIVCTFEDGGQAQLRHVVVDCLVLKDDKIMLIKRSPKLLEGGKWGIVGGYMERDETIEQAAKREILEETGWQVDDLVLLTINDDPDRPGEDRQNISFVYYCQATEKTGEPDWESTEQRWFGWDELPDELAFDHAEMIELYRQQLARH
jgi:8-oxo-dGTP diphosphatase